MSAPSPLLRTGVSCLLALFVVSLGACVPPYRVAVYNNTGGEILLRLDPAFLWPTVSAKRIPPGRHVIGYLVEMMPPGLVIEAGECVIGYDLPPVDDTYEAVARDNIHSVQVEPDFTVVLLPATAGGDTMPSARLLPLQKTYGYPVRPIFKKCEAGTASD